MHYVSAFSYATTYWFSIGLQLHSVHRMGSRIQFDWHAISVLLPSIWPFSLHYRQILVWKQNSVSLSAFSSTPYRIFAKLNLQCWQEVKGSAIPISQAGNASTEAMLNIAKCESLEIQVFFSICIIHTPLNYAQRLRHYIEVSAFYGSLLWMTSH